GEVDPRTSRVPVVASAERPARALVPLFMSEPLRVHLDGDFKAGPAQVRWNKQPVATRRGPAGGLVFEVDGAHVARDVNELELVVEAGSQLAQMRFEPTAPAPYHGPPWHRH